MVQISKASGATVLLVGMQIPPNYGIRYSRGFSELYSEIATSEAVQLVPNFLESVALAGGLMQADGIHPTAEAQPLLLQVIFAGLEPLLSR